MSNLNEVSFFLHICHSKDVVAVVRKLKSITPRMTFLARDSVQSTRPRSGWHTAMYLSMVKETVSHIDVPPVVHKSVL